MSESHFHSKQSNEGTPQKSSCNCSGCTKHPDTATNLETQCNREVNGKTRSTGSGSSHVRHDQIFAGLSPIDMLPILSDSQDKKARSTVNDPSGSTASRRGATQKYGARQEIGTQSMCRSTPPGAKTPMQMKPIYKCRTCDKAFSRNDLLSRHNRRVHSKTSMIQCGICKSFFANPETLQRHKLKLHSTSGTPRCPTCGITFTRRSSLSRHIREMHKGGSQYACKKCTAVFSRHAQLTTHYANVHDKDATFSCLACRKTFTSRAMAQRHIRKVHKKETTSSERFQQS